MADITDQYWNTMTELKAHCQYLHDYLVGSETWDRRLNCIVAIASSSSIGGWIIWREIAFVWAAIIALSQVINALRPYLPFSSRIKPLRGLSYAFDDLFIDLESNWFEVAQGELTEKEIHDLIIQFKRDQNALWKEHMADISLPFNRKIHSESVLIAEDYFRTKY